MHLLAPIALAAACAAAHAYPVVYDGGQPDLQQGYVSDHHLTGGTTPEVADHFTAGFPGNVAIPRQLRWWGGYAFGDGTPGADLFSVRLFGDSPSMPQGDPLWGESFYAANPVTRIATGMHLTMADGQQGPAIYEYTVDLDPAWVLAPGTGYWLSIQNDTSGDDDSWFWATSHPTAGAAAWREHYGDWSPLSASMAFQLSFDDSVASPVPEPASLALAIAGLAALRVTRRRSVPA